MVRKLPKEHAFGHTALPPAEAARRLAEVLSTRLPFALAARHGHHASITADWLCQVLAQCTAGWQKWHG